MLTPRAPSQQPRFRSLGQQSEPAEAEQAADNEDEGAEGQQRYREVELGCDPTNPRTQLAIDLAELSLIGRIVVVAGGGATDLLQSLLIHTVDDPPAKQCRLVALPDADRLDRDLGLCGVGRPGHRVDARG